MPPSLTCPRCAGGTTELLSGRELRVTRVRWDDGGAPSATREPIVQER
jgi:hydrogenase nickel incorporation protein HypA/HybF